MRLDFEKFLNVNGLKVGDKVKFENGDICEIQQVENNPIVLKILGCGEAYCNLSTLGVCDFEKIEPIKPKKTVGELTCFEFRDKYKCENCIFKKLGFGCGMIEGYDTLNSGKEAYLKKYPLVEPLRATIEAELDKEVEDDENI